MRAYQLIAKTQLIEKFHLKHLNGFYGADDYEASEVTTDITSDIISDVIQVLTSLRVHTFQGSYFDCCLTDERKKSHSLLNS